jgi:hypothetical protein
MDPEAQKTYGFGTLLLIYSLFGRRGQQHLVQKLRITNLFHFYCSFSKFLKLCWCDRKTKGKSLRNCVHNTDLELQYNALKAAFRQCTQAI